MRHGSFNDPYIMSYIKSAATLAIAGLTIVGTFAFATSSSWIGFKPSSHPHVPAKVKSASNSVIRIVFPGPPFEIVDLGNDLQIEAAVKKFGKANWEMIQLLYCRLENIPKCPVSALEKMGGGSAFVFKNKNTLATNLHNLQPWIQAVLLNNPDKAEDLGTTLSHIQVPIILSDRNGEAVFNPLENVRTKNYHISLIHSNPRLFRPDVNMNEFQFRVSDYVELTFAKEFDAEPLQVAPNVDGGDFFVIGFPGPTEIFAERGGIDGDGLTQMVSKGTQIASSHVSFWLDHLYSQYAMTINAPAYVGNSGGPVITADGKVAGIVMGGDLSKNADGTLVQIADFIKLQNSETLPERWRRDFPTTGE